MTEFEFQLHVTGTRALSAEYDFPVADAAATVARWRDLSLDAPRQATYAATVLGGVATLGFVWVGDPELGRKHAEALETIGRPSERRVVDLSYVDLQRRDDTVEGHALRRYWKGHYFSDLPDVAIEALLAHDPSVAASLQAYGGAIAEVPDDETAFSQRQTAFEYVGAARWTDPAEDDVQIETARESAGALELFASGVYVNVLGDDGPVGVSRAYSPAKLTRLTALKDAVDPENLFHRNQNIPPSTAVPIQ